MQFQCAMHNNYLAIIPQARTGSESIAHEAKDCCVTFKLTEALLGQNSDKRHGLEIAT